MARDAAITEWVIECGHAYRTGGAFYQLSKSEKIQARKQIAVLEKKTDRVYTGPEARALLGLPDTEVSRQAGPQRRLHHLRAEHQRQPETRTPHTAAADDLTSM